MGGNVTLLIICVIYSCITNQLRYNGVAAFKNTLLYVAAERSDQELIILILVHGVAWNVVFVISHDIAP